MILLQGLLYVLLVLAGVIEAAVDSPNSATVWANGQTVTITWDSFSGSEFTIVLYETGTVYHHTIVSYTPNTGSYSWQVEIPGADGWPATTSSQLVYEIDFYINGGWNNGGTLIAQSQEFAIVWNGAGGGASDPDPQGVVTTVVVGNDPKVETITEPVTLTQPTVTEIVQTSTQNQAWLTTVQTEIVVVGTFTSTQATTIVYEVVPVNPTNVVVTVTGASSTTLITMTVTSVTTALNVATPSQTTVTFQSQQVVGATTISAVHPGQLYNSGGRNGCSLSIMNLFAGLVLAVLFF
jgi:Ser-Thr-rich glycosyl-phosphatidyl-inositol-anchored membrane family